jgi:hypothetical protein
MAALTVLDKAQTSNGAEEAISVTSPYRFAVTVAGDAPLLFHSWNIEAIEEKAAAKKGSEAKKTDNIESYAYRTDAGMLGIPGSNFQACLREAGRFVPDPRSPRKSSMDLIRAGIVPLDIVAPFHGEKTTWDYEDRRRVTVMRAGVTRTRPAMNIGWEITFNMLVTTPEYLSPELVRQIIGQAGRTVGLCDFRPTYGRFSVTRFVLLGD